MSHTCDIFCDCKTLKPMSCETCGPTNCKTCGDTNCVRQGDQNYVCIGWCKSLVEKEYDVRYMYKKEDVLMSAPRTCNNCYYKTMGVDAAYTCDSCIIPHKNKKENWKAKLPEKHENLTWWEADKLWHEGWLVRRTGNQSEANFWNFDLEFDPADIRATDWYIVGRQDNVKDPE